MCGRFSPLVESVWSYLLENLADPELLDIPEVAQAARIFFFSAGPPLDSSEMDVLEMVARVSVRSVFKDILGGKVDAKVMDQFCDAFFNYTYPTPPVDFLSDQQEEEDCSQDSD